MVRLVRDLTSAKKWIVWAKKELSGQYLNMLGSSLTSIAKAKEAQVKRVPGNVPHHHAVSPVNLVILGSRKTGHIGIHWSLAWATVTIAIAQWFCGLERTARQMQQGWETRVALVHHQNQRVRYARQGVPNEMFSRACCRHVAQRGKLSLTFQPACLAWPWMSCWNSWVWSAQFLLHCQLKMQPWNSQSRVRSELGWWANRQC